MSAPRLATVGAGFFARFHHNAWHRLHCEGQVEHAAVCDKDAAAARRFADVYAIERSYDDFERMLREVRPDLVDIITPPPTHVAFVRAALAAGARVICQKPFTPSLSEAQALAHEIEAQGALVVVHENFRFQPWYAEVARLLRDGVLGQIFQFTFRLRPGDGQGADAYLSRQPYFQQMPRFLIHETAIHVIDVFRFLGGEIISVYAQLDRLNPAIAGEDAGMVLFGLDNGVRALFDGNRLVDHVARDRRLTMGELWIEGAAGTLRLNGDGELWLRRYGDNEEQPVAFVWQDVDFGGDCVYRLQAGVLRHLREGSEPPNTAAAYLRNLQIEDAVYRSAAEGCKVWLRGAGTPVSPG